MTPQPPEPRAGRDERHEPALEELRGLWHAVHPPALPPEDLAQADPTTRAAVAWVRTAITASTAPCPAPANRRLPPRRVRPAWRRPTLAAAALLLALAVGLQRAPHDTLDDPQERIASTGGQPAEAPPYDAQMATNDQSTALSAPDVGLTPPRGLAARPSDAGLELQAGPVRLTYITSPKTL